MNVFVHKRHRLTSKLLWMFLFSIIIMLLILVAIISTGFKERFQSHVHPHIIQYMNYIRKDIGSPPDVQRAQTIALEFGVGLIIYRDHEVLHATANAPGLPALQAASHGRPDDRHYMADYQGKHYIVDEADDYSLAFVMPEREHSIGVVLWPLALFLLLLVLLYHSIYYLFKPLQAIRQGIARYADGDLQHQIQVKRHDELGELAEDINKMAAEISSLLDSKRDLLLAISHELRTPLARAHLALELSDVSQPGEIARELEEMDRLIADLLESERLGSGHQLLHSETLDLNSLIRDVLAADFAKEALALHSELDSAPFQGDMARLRVVLVNIIRNALQHTPAGRQGPDVHLKEQDGFYRIEIKDFGDGANEAELRLLSNAFYRTDKARQRQTGGVGLGLYLCRAIVQAHQGELQIRNWQGGGLQVSVLLPKPVQI